MQPKPTPEDDAARNVLDESKPGHDLLGHTEYRVEPSSQPGVFVVVCAQCGAKTNILREFH